MATREELGYRTNDIRKDIVVGATSLPLSETVKAFLRAEVRGRLDEAVFELERCSGLSDAEIRITVRIREIV